ncbi:MAG: hypothetical protein QME69_10220 [Candidatus Saccharicenans sp.]|nr:hypothetical protein [Candidatus Saccharicenans sp.]
MMAGVLVATGPSSQLKLSKNGALELPANFDICGLFSIITSAQNEKKERRQGTLRLLKNQEAH